MQPNEINPGHRKVLISGGTGFLGSFVAKRFVDKGEEVTILKRPSSSLSRISEVVDSLSLIDIDDFDGGDFDLFIHTASSYGRAGESEKEVESTNVDLPLKILSKLNLEKLHLINISTSLPSHVNLYAKTKHLFVKKVRQLHPSLLFSNLIAEQFYGPHDGTFISMIVEKLKLGVTEIPLTLGQQKRDCIYFEDVIDAIDVISNSSKGGDFPLGSGNMYLIKDIVTSISELLNNTQTKLEFGKIEYRENEVMISKADTSRLREIGWEPKFDLISGLKKTLEKW